MTGEPTRRAWSGDTVRIVEHDDATRQPREGGKVLLAQVTEDTGSIYAHVRYDAETAEWAGREIDTYYQESGWRAWDGEFRWRLMSDTPEPDDITCGETDEEATPSDALIHDLAIILAGFDRPAGHISAGTRLVASRVRDVLGITPGELTAGIEDKLAAVLTDVTFPPETAECRFCRQVIKLLGGSWTAPDGAICCYENRTSASYAPHQPEATK